MLAYLSGLVKERTNGDMILAVGSESTTGGIGNYVGYQVKTPDHPRYEAYIPGQRAEIYLYTHVREDALDLYGFLNTTEKQLFMILISVSGVGPKMALGLLSFTDAASLIHMILDEDKEALTSISGVGKKTAERIILELKDTLKKKIESNTLNVSAKSGSENNAINRASTIFVESYLALQALGYKEAQAKMLIEKALAEVPGKESPKKVEDVIKLALQATL